MRLLFATHNPHKVEEVRSILQSSGVESLELLSLSDLSDFVEIPEEGSTLEENALQKAREVWKRHQIPCFADDTGLEVAALDGAPGVFSARYAGPECRAEDNVTKLLAELHGELNRAARFRTVIALHMGDKEHLFSGEILGEILTSPRGENGFGYDPIFQPKGEVCSFAEMSSDEKNHISHRYRAILALADFLEEYLRV